jgi:vacuolar protein sorting-associated protein 13A/C
MDLMLLGIEFKDEGMVGMRSQYAVVNTNNPEDVPLENRMTVLDEDGLALNLGLHYMSVFFMKAVFVFRLSLIHVPERANV